MGDVLSTMFESDFMPHGHCYMWQQDIVWLHAGSDALIAASYYAIPFLLLYFLHKRRDLEFKRMFVMFGAFIMLCGTTHVLEIWSIWNGAYRLTGTIKLLTGIVSAATAGMLLLAMPRAIAIPSPKQLEETNASLRREIEARTQVESALRDSEERFREAFTHSAMGKALVSPEGVFTRVNDALCQMAGYDRAELAQLTFQEITHPDDLEADLEMVRRMMEGEIRSYQLEKRYLRKDGSILWILLSVAATWTDAGEVNYFIVEVQDITERKQWQKEQQQLLEEVAAERDKLRAAEEQLEQANLSLKARNHELQEFAYVASHDLQEPLRKIIAFADLMKEDCGTEMDELAGQYVERIQHASLRMSQLLNDLLQFSRVTTHNERNDVVDLNEVIANVLSDHELAIEEKKAQISVDQLPTLEADPVHMRQLFNNLIGNAIKYARDHVTPLVRISCTELENTFAIIVADNGIGFEPRYAERIFMPFERLHGQRYGGTGMGLAICKRIVERHGGSITAEGQPGAGARFIIQLPSRTSERA